MASHLIAVSGVHCSPQMGQGSGSTTPPGLPDLWGGRGVLYQLLPLRVWLFPSMLNNPGAQVFPLKRELRKRESVPATNEMVGEGEHHMFPNLGSPEGF